jgi:hypothetical protein
MERLTTSYGKQIQLQSILLLGMDRRDVLGCVTNLNNPVCWPTLGTD